MSRRAKNAHGDLGSPKIPNERVTTHEPLISPFLRFRSPNPSDGMDEQPDVSRLLILPATDHKTWLDGDLAIHRNLVLGRTRVLIYHNNTFYFITQNSYSYL